MVESVDEQKTRVFISYSRKDTDFAQTLTNKLVARGFEAYLDKKDILPGEPWRERLGGLIAAAHCVVFIISPDSISSEICAWETEETARLGKRLLPLMYRTVLNAAVPPRLSRLNYLFFDGAGAANPRSSEYQRTFEHLCTALDADIGWIREHTRLADLAAAWVRGGQLKHDILRGDSLAAAEQWLRSPPKSATRPTELHEFFIETSRRLFDIEEQEKLEAYNKALISQSRLLSDVSHRLSAVGRKRIAIELALEALPHDLDNPHRPLVPEAEAALLRAAFDYRERRRLVGHTGWVSSLQWSLDGTRLATMDRHINARVWDAASGNCLASFDSDAMIWRIQLGPTGNELVTSGLWPCAGPTFWDVAEKKQVRRLWEESFGPFYLSYSQDYRLMALALGTKVHIIGLSDLCRCGEPYEHDEEVIESLFSEAGGTLVTRTANSITVHSLDGPPAEKRVWQHERGVDCMAVSASGTLVAAGSKDGAYLIRTGTMLADRLDVGASISSVNFSPDERKLIAAASDKTVRLWSTETLEASAPLVGFEDDIRIAEFNPTGDRIVTSAGKSLKLWFGDGRPIFELTGHEENHALAHSPDGRLIGYAASETMVNLWDLTSNTLYAQLTDHEDKVSGIVFSPVSAEVATVSYDAMTRIWSTEPSEDKRVFWGHAATVSDVVLSPDGRRIATASRDNAAWIWDVASTDPAAKLSTHSNAVISVRFSPDGGRLLTASEDGSARIWQHAGDSWRTTLLDSPGTRLEAAEFNADGSLVATHSNAGQITVWDASSGKRLHAIPSTSMTGAIAFAPDGAQLLGMDADTIKVWNSRDGSVIREMRIDDESSTNAIIMASPSTDWGRVFVAKLWAMQVWDVAEGRLLSRIARGEYAIHGIAISGDGSRVITNRKGKDAVEIWDADSGLRICALRTADEVGKIALDHTGRRALTAFADGTARLWDADSAVEILALVGHEKGIASMRFAADGRSILTASWDATARQWLLPSTGKLIERCRRHLSRALSPDERRKYFLDEEPPAWIIEQGIPPYDGRAWKDWLESKRSTGVATPMPRLP